MSTTITICTTCKHDGALSEEPPAGLALAHSVREAVAALGDAAHIRAQAIACLSNCSRGCSATVSAPGKFSYVIGGLTPEAAEALATFALRHAESSDGVPAWRDRPEIIRKNTVARVPPDGVAHKLIEKIDDLTPRR